MMQQLKILISVFAVMMVLVVGMKTINDSNLLETTDSFTETYFDYADSTLELSEEERDNITTSENNSYEISKTPEKQELKPPETEHSESEDGIVVEIDLK